MREQNGQAGDTGTPAGGREMTAWDAIRSRRDVREFDGRPIADADLDQILEAGRRSPSSNNWQPWDFIVVTNREQLTELAKVWRGGGHVAQSAATIALIAPAADERQRAPFDLGQATMSIMLAAAGLGIGSGHSAVADQDLARRLLGFPEDKTCAFLIPLGYPTGRPLTPIRHPNRRPFDDVVHRGRW
jgi:nitroreductase